MEGAEVLANSVTGVDGSVIRMVVIALTCTQAEQLLHVWRLQS